MLICLRPLNGEDVDRADTKITETKWLVIICLFGCFTLTDEECLNLGNDFITS